MDLQVKERESTVIPRGRGASPVHLAESAVASLEAELRASIRGEVRFDAGSRALYATDGSNYRQVPIGVTCPRDAEDVKAILAACRRHGAPVLSRGGRHESGGAVLQRRGDHGLLEVYAGVLEVDRERRLGRVEPGAFWTPCAMQRSSSI